MQKEINDNEIRKINDNKLVNHYYNFRSRLSVDTKVNEYLVK